MLEDPDATVFLDDQGRWACLHCGSVFNNRAGASRHALYCSDRDEMQCSRCGQWLEGEWDWINHQEFHRSGYAFRCRLGCSSLWFGRVEAMLEHHSGDHGITYRSARAQKILPVPLLPTAQVLPNANGSAKYVSPSRRYIHRKIRDHCGALGNAGYRFASAESAQVLCRACIAHKLSDPDHNLPPPEVLERRSRSAPRRSRKGERHIVRKAERQALQATQSTVTCANSECAVMNIREARNTSKVDAYLCIPCSTFARRNPGESRPANLQSHVERRRAGIAYVRPDHECKGCGVTTGPRWYRVDGGHICAYCHLYQKAHNGEQRPLWLEAERAAKGVAYICCVCEATESKVWRRVAGSVRRRCQNCHHWWELYGEERPSKFEAYRTKTSPHFCSHCRAGTTPKWFRDGEGGHRCLACHRHAKKHKRLPTAREISKRKPIQSREPSPSPCSNSPCDKNAVTMGLCKNCRRRLPTAARTAVMSTLIAGLEMARAGTAV